MTTNNLTEQWKRGELEEGEYYIKSNKGDIYIDICANGSFMFTNYRSVEEVLAPVPSYEEIQKLQNSLEHEKVRATHYYKTLTKIEDENEKLEELLIDFTKRIEHYKEVKPDVGFIMFDLGYLANQVKEVLK